MTVEVKICGVRTPAILDATITAGADFVGFVFLSKSPRNLAIADAANLAATARGRAKTVAVVVDPDDGLIDRIVSEVRPDVVQLHGSETPERAAEIKTRTGLAIFKAVPVGARADVELAAPYKGIADQVLFDAKAPAGADLPGGNGVPFDWTLLDCVARPFALAGGLDAANVAEAIDLSGASLVDVSSGVETALGEKDPGLIAEFVRTVRGAESKHMKAS